MFDDFGASHVAMVIELNPYGKGLADNLAMTGDGEFLRSSNVRQRGSE
jgi:hypothetical protein